MSNEPAVILLVEDNEGHAELVMRGLADHPISTRVAHLVDGQIALDYLFRQNQYADPATSPRPDLVLLDLRLPRVDGVQVLKAIKETEALTHIPVVILTTSNAERDVRQAYAYHANSYLVKPVGFEEFASLLQNLIWYWLSWNTHPPIAP